MSECDNLEQANKEIQWLEVKLDNYKEAMSNINKFIESDYDALPQNKDNLVAIQKQFKEAGHEAIAKRIDMAINFIGLGNYEFKKEVRAWSESLGMD